MMIAGSRFGDARHARGKLHGVSQVIAPVAGGRRLGHQLPGEIRGQRNLRRVVFDARRQTVSNSSSISSISGEWNACDTLSSFTCTPSASNFASQLFDRVRFAGDHDVFWTVDHGDHDFAAGGFDFLATRSRDANTTAILPCRLHALHEPCPFGNQPQAVFQLITPATQAAAYSPTLWPSTISGITPHDAHNSASAYSSANSAGCVYSRLMEQCRRLVGRECGRDTERRAAIRRPSIRAGWHRNSRAPAETRAAIRTARGPCRRIASPGR